LFACFEISSSTSSNGFTSTVSGVVILITLTQPNPLLLSNGNFKFVLHFEDSKNYTVLPRRRKVLPSQVMTRDGTQFVSFPENNVANYPDDSSHVFIISPKSGKPFKLTITYQDISGEPNDYFTWASMVDGNGRSAFEYEGWYVYNF